jgi:hypothetical protein
MNDHTLEIAFAQWWQDSYGRPPGVHAAMTHVAFARHMLELLELMAPQSAADTRSIEPAEPTTAAESSPCPC